VLFVTSPIQSFSRYPHHPRRLSPQLTYASYFEFINDPANGFSTMTLPFAGGLEMSVHSKV
jgi:hypothetical protein